MDFCLNVSISSEYQQEQLLSPPSSELNGSSSSLDDLFPSQNMEEDLSLEWLSVFVEDCLTSSGNCLPPPTSVQTQKPSKTLDFQKPQTKPTSLESFTVPSKARSKRKRDVLTKRRDPLTIWSSHQTLQLTMNPDPPLLQQAHWLADSELIVPKNEEEKGVLVVSTKDKEEKVQPLGLGLMGHGLQPVARRCSHCLAHRTPQWRAGPLGPKTLCNACGVRYKSGRLLPEYRPAKSPTFVSYLHSNSHKKVMEMRNGS